MLARQNREASCYERLRHDMERCRSAQGDVRLCGGNKVSGAIPYLYEGCHSNFAYQPGLISAHAP